VLRIEEMRSLSGGGKTAFPPLPPRDLVPGLSNGGTESKPSGNSHKEKP